MAVAALAGSGFVDANEPSAKLPGLAVAQVARDLFVGSFQFVTGVRRVIKKRGPPPERVVAAPAVSLAFPGCELPAVCILVTTGTVARRVSKGGVLQPGALSPRQMTGRASCPLVGAFKKKASRRVVEAGKILPTLDRMAGGAGHGLSILAERCHPGVELPLVRILMTGGAGDILEMKL